MIEEVQIDEGVGLDDYSVRAHLLTAVSELRSLGAVLVPRLNGRRVWMVNSTAEGGGVAEMLPKVIDLLRELGVDAHWLVINCREEAFFELTKRIHNAIHGHGDRPFTETDRDFYEKVSRRLASQLGDFVDRDDILVVHDPQPMAVGAFFVEQNGIRSIWRSHIGVDEESEVSQQAWEFLKPYACAYDHAVFSAPEYIPPYLAGNSSVITPAIDPLNHKNRELTAHKLTGILCNAGLQDQCHPVVTPAWENQARRFLPDGSFARIVNSDHEIGLLYRPIVTQVSRWDRLKGWKPLLDGFLHLMENREKRSPEDQRFQRVLKIVRLVFAGPDPEAIQDDPEAREVLDELCDTYLGLPSEMQNKVALLSLPMQSRKENALMVNALHRCSTVVAQNSIREGFGLTATEAMWKAVPVLGSSACGLRQQIRDRVDGILTQNPEDPEEVADNLQDMLRHPVARDRWGHAAQRNVYDKFLVFSQVGNWLRQLVEVVQP